MATQKITKEVKCTILISSPFIQEKVFYIPRKLFSRKDKLKNLIEKKMNVDFSDNINVEIFAENEDLYIQL
ncbi:MAG: hypothetical protein HKO92_02195 [Flavobacteriaceae bacterium]|nr:hypothetical protein [Flavobacteriaceae bacterium]